MADSARHQHRSDVLGHIKITHHQYNAEFFQKNINKKGNRDGIVEQFTGPTNAKNIEVDLSVAGHLHDEIVQLENYIIRKTKAAEFIYVCRHRTEIRHFFRGSLIMARTPYPASISENAVCCT